MFVGDPVTGHCPVDVLQGSKAYWSWWLV